MRHLSKVKTATVLLSLAPPKEGYFLPFLLLISLLFSFWVAYIVENGTWMSKGGSAGLISFQPERR